MFKALMIFATVVLLFALIVLCAYAWNLMTFPYDYDQGEGFELVDTILFSQFRSPYQNTDSYPFYSSNYPPLYHVIAAPFVWIFGESYWYGRLLSLLSALIAAIAIGFAVYREGHHRWIALLSGLAFLSSNTIYHIAPLLRQHIMMVMFETVAIVILVQAYPKRQKCWILIGLLLIIAAGYTKQLAAITAIAVIAWMILRNPRRGILWTLGFTITGGLIFAWMTLATNGEWWRQAIVANVNAFDPFQTFGLAWLWLRLHAFLIIPALLLVLHDIYFERLSLYSIWFIGSVILGAAGSGTWGAGDSYFATAIAAMCILSGIFFSRIIQRIWIFRDNYIKRFFQLARAHIGSPLQALYRIAILLIPILYLSYGISTFKMPTDGAIFGTIADVLGIEANVLDRHYDSATYDVLGYANIGHFVTADDRVAGDFITEQIRQTDAPVMSEEAGFSLVAGRDVITNPTQLRNLWLADLWDGSDLLSMIENREFGLIILRAQFYPTPALEMMGQHYTIDDVIVMNGFEYWLLRPLSSE
ncbi:MAG: glycosyltransferase family 39 protein [Anaerolineae bacterium]|nr:glycosyltransferase family 39 protein [Anaerolineae bacterium]